MELDSNILKIVQQFIFCFDVTVAFPDKKIIIRIWRIGGMYFRNHQKL